MLLPQHRPTGDISKESNGDILKESRRPKYFWRATLRRTKLHAAGTTQPAEQERMRFQLLIAWHDGIAREGRVHISLSPFGN
jgi:hypothetical protein